MPIIIPTGIGFRTYYSNPSNITEVMINVLTDYYYHFDNSLFLPFANGLQNQTSETISDFIDSQYSALCPVKLVSLLFNGKAV